MTENYVFVFMNDKKKAELAKLEQVTQTEFLSKIKRLVSMGRISFNIFGGTRSPVLETLQLLIAEINEMYDKHYEFNGYRPIITVVDGDMPHMFSVAMENSNISGYIKGPGLDRVDFILELISFRTVNGKLTTSWIVYDKWYVMLYTVDLLCDKRFIDYIKLESNIASCCLPKNHR